MPDVRSGPILIESWRRRAPAIRGCLRNMVADPSVDQCFLLLTSVHSSDSTTPSRTAPSGCLFSVYSLYSLIVTNTQNVAWRWTVSSVPRESRYSRKPQSRTCSEHVVTRHSIVPNNAIFMDVYRPPTRYVPVSVQLEGTYLYIHIL